jgi:hypothetical protein
MSVNFHKTFSAVFKYKSIFMKLFQIEVNSDKGIAVLYVPVKEDFDAILAVSI